MTFLSKSRRLVEWRRVSSSCCKDMIWEFFRRRQDMICRVLWDLSSSQGLELRIMRWCKHKTAKHFAAAWLVRTGLYEVRLIMTYNKSSQDLELHIMQWWKHKTAKHFTSAWLVRTGLYEVGLKMTYNRSYIRVAKVFHRVAPNLDSHWNCVHKSLPQTSVH